MISTKLHWPGLLFAVAVFTTIAVVSHNAWWLAWILFTAVITFGGWAVRCWTVRREARKE